MTVIVADTSPLNYLVLIGEIAVLPGLYRRVVIPPEVQAELMDDDAPPQVSRWMESQPEWLHVRPAPVVPESPTLAELDPGERAAIALATSEHDALLLIDDAAGRAEANRRQIRNVGTLGILRAAAMRELLDLPAALKRLERTNFRVSPALVADLLAEHLQRTRRRDD